MPQAKTLVVDDDPVTLRTITRLLEQDGHEVRAVGSGQEALAAIQAEPSLDLVLLDVVLPDLDGVAICRQVKGDPKTEQVPVILISAFRKDDENIREGLNAGADGYLIKPIEDTALRAWVRAALRIRRLQRELTAHGVADCEDLLGRFAKLSHAVNNPLQALYAAVDLLDLKLPKDDAITPLLTNILLNAERVTQLVAQASLEAKTLLQSSATPRLPR